MNNYFLCTAAVMAVICFIHCWFGGKLIAAPLLATRELHRVPKYTHYYCWHLVSVLLGMMALAFLWVGLHPQATELAVFIVIMACIFSLWSFVLVTWKKQRISDFPQGAMFAVAAVIGVIGLFE